VVYIEQLTGAMYLGKRADADHYRDVINQVGATSMSPERTVRFFAEVIREM
jgi:hypothetical protein